MKKSILIIILMVVAFSGYNSASSQVIDRKSIIDSLTTLDPNLVGYFPRWKICESDLLVQIHQGFLYKGYSAEDLSVEDIQILAAPKEYESDPYEILLLSCGKASMNVVEIETNFGDMMIGYLSGELSYKGRERGYRSSTNQRDYCYTNIPSETPVTPSQAAVITDFLGKPLNVDHSFSISLFEQLLKVGETGFWLRSFVGTDEAGYQYWTSGEAKIMLQRPLYVNQDLESKKGIPYLINAYLGAGYRLTGGVNDDGSLLSWVRGRKLNAAPDGKLIFGTDIHAWFHPQAGISFNAELPLTRLYTELIDQRTYASYAIGDRLVDFQPHNQYALTATRKGIVPILRATGQFSVFYHLWLNKANPENYFRINLGLNYTEVEETLMFENRDDVENSLKHYYSIESIDGLKTYKPESLSDWLYFKLEYRNQAVFPFGISGQISNKIFLGRIYIPLLGNWLYLDAKYSTPLRDAYPFELENFFMISPVLRFTI